MGDQKHLGGHFEGPDLAAKHWVLSTSELLEAGLSRRQITRRVDTGVLFRKFHGVYAVGRPDLSFQGCCRAAWLACGLQSAISHISGARDWNLRRSTGRIHISVPRGRKGHPELVVHRSRSLAGDDIVMRDGYAVTSVSRTILDMAPGQDPQRVARWIHEAGVQRVLDFREMLATLERHPHHRGVRVVDAALNLHVDDTRSDLEDAWLEISRKAGVPAPVSNEYLSSGAALEEVDFFYPQLNLIVEVDGGRYHWSRWRRRNDAAKDARFRATGRTVWRVPELRIALDPVSLAAELRELAAGVGP